MTLRAVLCAELCAVALAGGLIDDPIAGDANAVQYLDGKWSVSGVAGSPINISARVPGDLISDLEAAGIVGDPLFGFNFQGSVWDSENWTYAVDFTPAAAVLAGADAYLVFDSLKMAGDVFLNGVWLGEFQDQFLRYAFPVSGVLRPGANSLRVVFTTSADPRNADGRWMACSGAWDWAPYGTTFTAQQDHTFSKGIVKSVYLVPASRAGITHVVPKTYYTGPYPTAPLTDDSAAPFAVAVSVVLLVPPGAPAGATGTVSVSGSWDAAHPMSVPVGPLSPGENVVDVHLASATGVKLWWPLSLGAQALYTVTATFTPTGLPGAAASTSRPVGFRVAYLVTANDTDPKAFAGLTGSDDFTMRFKINGADVWARGANQIPMEELEGRQDAAAYTAMLSAAAAANHNMLRVWGGGIFLPSVFYDTADALGIMLYHDAMYGTPWFGGKGGQPTNTPTQAAEIAHSIRRLACHPSIVLWDGGNEDLGRWDSTIENFEMPAIVAVDDSRPVWPASPSNGWSSGVDRLTGRPDGQPFVVRGGAVIETHGPYQHGAGFKTVNGDGSMGLFPANVPPGLAAPSTSYGPGQRGTFASEFGCSVFSSFESMAPTLASSDWSAHAPPMVQRNYPTDNIVSVYFGADVASCLNQTGTKSLQRATYLGMLGQALQQKSDIEARRSGNAWGTLTWQLNEIWPTGGWGSLEYGTVGYTPGQILGGRWKPLHHWMASHLYRDTVLICGANAACVVKHDGAVAGFDGAWSTSLIRVSNGIAVGVGSGLVSLPRGAGSAAWVCADGKGNPANGPCTSFSALLAAAGCSAGGVDCYLQASLTDTTGSVVVDSNSVLLAAPADIVLPDAILTVDVATAPNPDASINVTISTTETAFFVTLTTTEPGVFSDNAFILPAGTARDLQLRAIVGAPAPNPSRLKASLRADHVAAYTGPTC